MGWQEFRDEELWTLEVDDLFRNNKVAIENIYKTYSSGKVFTKNDAIMLAETFNLPLTIRSVVLAYSQSKETLVDEMNNYDTYNDMTYTEFLEFLARCAT